MGCFYEVVREGGFNKMTFEQRTGESEGPSKMGIWRRRFQVDETAGTKALQSATCLYGWPFITLKA